MSERFDDRLRAWLAHRERMAAAATSPQRVLERVEAAMGGVAAPPRSRRRVLAPVAAGVAVAAVLASVVGLSLRLHGRGTVPATPAAAGPWVRGVVPRTTPPPGVPLAWVRDPRDTTRAIAFDWNGRAVGSLALPHPPSMPIADWTASPDGSRLVVDAPDGSAQWVITAQGARVGTLPAPPENTPHDMSWWPVIFADDNRTICQERYVFSRDDLSPRSIWVISPDGRQRLLGPEAPANAPAGLRWSMLTCSTRSDLVTVVGDHYEAPTFVESTPQSSATQSGGMGRLSMGVSVTVHNHPSWAVMFRELRLSTGAEVLRRVYPDRAVGSLRASADGTRVVEGPMTSGPYSVHDLRSGVVRPFSGNLSFAGAQSSRLLRLDERSANGPTDLTLLDWDTGATVWQHTLAGSDSVAGWQPDGDGALISVLVFSNRCPVREEDSMVDAAGELIALTRGADRCP